MLTLFLFKQHFIIPKKYTDQNMPEVDDSKILKIGDVLNNPDRPLKERFRALFTLKNIGGATAIDCIKKAFDDPSALLKHELAYCLGQMQDHLAIPILKDVLRDKNEHPMVRHEAAEGLGAIGKDHVLPLLKEFANDEAVPVAETCQLAIRRIEWVRSGNEGGKDDFFGSVDPTPASEERNLCSLREKLLSESTDLYERYRALFALRNINSKESTKILSEGLKYGGALFRHELAFVLGQIQEPIAVDALIQGLEDKSQDEMVRHECAEALGAIATEKAMKVLEGFLEDEIRVVRESCEIALDMCEYENSTELQYANTLELVDS
ncbi:deoxyhypusine hydroxylase [Neocloeon triangulifer]|uniref:deoxyhypusine hydroxylase n=1 Tax=Neocloeon triangulifer TaxID=2078957 RepID=UPI00286EF6B2|nr:deoxyhypusine hydroxylase [Neocloeon triangulifer]